MSKLSSYVKNNTKYIVAIGLIIDTAVAAFAVSHYTNVQDKPHEDTFTLQYHGYKPLTDPVARLERSAQMALEQSNPDLVERFDVYTFGNKIHAIQNSLKMKSQSLDEITRILKSGNLDAGAEYGKYLEYMVNTFNAEHPELKITGDFSYFASKSVVLAGN